MFIEKKDLAVFPISLTRKGDISLLTRDFGFNLLFSFFNLSTLLLFLPHE
jgi:hypothetical protein